MGHRAEGNTVGSGQQAAEVFVISYTLLVIRKKHLSVQEDRITINE